MWQEKMLESFLRLSFIFVSVEQSTNMSNYEYEHNLSTGTTPDPESASEADLVTRNAQNIRQRRQTLQQAITNFLSSPGNINANISNFNNLEALLNEGLFEAQPQMAEMLRSILQSVDSTDLLMLNRVEDPGVPESFLDTLERVDIKSLKDDDTCPICTIDYKSDEHPLVVELPCNSKHRFDLECISPWLKVHKTCPLCRVDVTIKKKKEDIPVDSEEEEEAWEMYG